MGRSALQEVQRWAAAHPERDLSVEVLARHAGLSPRHFARLFRIEVGITPAAWVEMTRIATARTLLETGSVTPKQVVAGEFHADCFEKITDRKGDAGFF